MDASFVLDHQTLHNHPTRNGWTDGTVVRARLAVSQSVAADAAARLHPDDVMPAAIFDYPVDMLAVPARSRFLPHLPADGCARWLHTNRRAR